MSVLLYNSSLITKVLLWGNIISFMVVCLTTVGCLLLTANSSSDCDLKENISQALLGVLCSQMNMKLFTRSVEYSCLFGVFVRGITVTSLKHPSCVFHWCNC